MTTIDVTPTLSVTLLPAGEVDDQPAVAIQTAEGGVVLLLVSEIKPLVAVLIDGASTLAAETVAEAAVVEAARCEVCGGVLAGDHCEACHQAAEDSYQEERLSWRAVYQASTDDGGLVVRLTPPLQCVACGELASVGLVSLGWKVLPVCQDCVGELASASS